MSFGSQVVRQGEAAWGVHGGLDDEIQRVRCELT